MRNQADLSGQTSWTGVGGGQDAGLLPIDTSWAGS